MIHTSYTVGITTAEFLSLQNVMIDQLDWIENAIQIRARIAIDDIVLDADIPHLIIQPHPWRRLKTKGSHRTIPLVGFSLWSAQQIKKCSICQYAFPRYIRNNECLSNSASAAVNKWLKIFIPKECSVHSFRHSMRDRLRAVECPKEIIDQIGGWSSGDVGESYGNGFPLDNIEKWLIKIIKY